MHIFDRICIENAIEHRLTKVKHQWTNGQVERMNRTIQESTVNKYFYKDYDELNGYLLCFLRAYNYVKQLKTLRGLTLYEFVMKVWQNEPSRFVINPHHLSAGSRV
jgi:transposase InsO family protein